jgi:hypothetical protein
VSVRLTISASGRVTGISPDVATTALVGCMGNVFAAARFPRSHRGAQVVQSFAMPAAAAPLPPAIEAKDPMAEELTHKAYDKARAGKCATVKALGHRVQDLDPDYYARVFVIDAAIAVCLR